MCRSCWDLQEKRGGYLRSTEKVDDASKCDVHPTLDNWRTFRVLRTLKTWSLEQPGFQHPSARGVRLVVESGHVHRRTAEAILFDYEAPLVDLLIHERLVLQHEGTPRTLTVSAKGDRYIRTRLAKQAKVAA